MRFYLSATEIIHKSLLMSLRFTHSAARGTRRSSKHASQGDKEQFRCELGGLLVCMSTGVTGSQGHCPSW